MRVGGGYSCPNCQGTLLSLLTKDMSLKGKGRWGYLSWAPYMLLVVSMSLVEFHVPTGIPVAHYYIYIKYKPTDEILPWVGTFPEKGYSFTVLAYI